MFCCIMTLVRVVLRRAQGESVKMQIAGPLA